MPWLLYATAPASPSKSVTGRKGASSAVERRNNWKYNCICLFFQLWKERTLEYKLLFKVIPELPTDSTIFLPEHINFDSPDKLTIHLSQEDGETNENLKARADREVQREPLRISVLEDIFFNMEYTSSSPQLRYGFVGQASTMCIFRPVRRTGAVMRQDHWTHLIGFTSSFLRLGRFC